MTLWHMYIIQVYNLLNETRTIFTQIYFLWCDTFSSLWKVQVCLSNRCEIQIVLTCSIEMQMKVGFRLTVSERS
jgi:hypothetical protein